MHAQAHPTPPLPARGEGSAGAPEGTVQGNTEAASRLLHLSHREAALGHIDEALDSAREAHRALRSRASLTHLIRLLTVARRFEPQDRERLRRAVRKQPNAPVLLHAAGVSESLHGDPWAARGLLLEALRHERREELRAEILGVLTSLEAPQHRTFAPANPNPPGSAPPTPGGPSQEVHAPPQPTQ
jgi:thioredoxin-like negative regulator of GroEL